MLSRRLNLIEHVLHLLRHSLRINIHIRHHNMKQHDHILNALRQFKRMRLCRGLKAKPVFFYHPPVVLEVVLSPVESCGADGAGMLVLGEDAGLADAEEVHEISL